MRLLLLALPSPPTEAAAAATPPPGSRMMMMMRIIIADGGLVVTDRVDNDLKRSPQSQLLMLGYCNSFLIQIVTGQEPWDKDLKI